MVSAGWIALGKFKKVVKALVYSCQKRSYSIQLKRETIYVYHSISPRFCPEASREALRKTLSNASTFLAKYGFQAGAAYSRTGRTRDLYNVENAPGFDEPTVLWTKPSNLLALLTVTLTCSLRDKSEETIMPISLTHFTLLRLVPNEYVGREKSRLCVMRKTSHLSGLKRSCHLDA